MKLTKYQHSCFTLEKNDHVLIVDPGAWTTDFIIPQNVVAVVVTHEHADHFDPEKLAAIAAAYPEVTIYGPAAVTTKIPDLPTQSVVANDRVEIGGFDLLFVGGEHATILKDFHPPFENIGVIVDDILYHPGDSLVVPEQPIRVLSVPIVAPWEKVAESVDFLLAIKPEIAFPTHDVFLNEKGIALYDRWHQMASEKYSISYQRLTDFIEI